jgi:hypothetical protein
MGNESEAVTSLIDEAFRVRHVDGATFIAHSQLRTFVAVDRAHDGTIRPLAYDYDAYERAIREDNWTPTPVDVEDLPEDVESALVDRLSRPTHPPKPEGPHPPINNGS